MTVNLTACGFIYGEHGLIKDKTNDYLKAKEGKNLVIPESLKHENKVDYAQIPAIANNAESSKPGKKLTVNPAPTQILDVKDNVRTDKSAPFPTVFIEDEKAFLWQSLEEFFQDKKITPITTDIDKGLLDTGWIAQSKKGIWRGIEGSDEIDDFRTKYQFTLASGDTKDEFKLQIKRVSAQVLNDDNDQWEELEYFSQDSKDMLNMFLSFYDQKYIERNTRSSNTLVKFKVELGQNEKGDAALIAHAGKQQVWLKLPRVLNEAKLEVNDQDRRLMIYFFKYEKNDPGFFASLFGAEPDEIPLEDGNYQVKLSDIGERTAITFRNAQGVALSDEMVVKLYPVIGKYFGSNR